MKKKCIKCFEEKEYKYFNNDKRNKTWVKWTCKSCIKLYRRNNPINKEKQKEYDKNRYLLNRKEIIDRNICYKNNNPEQTKIRNKEYLIKNKENRTKYNQKYNIEKKFKIICHRLITKFFIQEWKTKPTRCYNCNIEWTKIHLHHYDYNKWNEIYPLCPSCHAKVHSKINTLKIDKEQILILT